MKLFSVPFSRNGVVSRFMATFALLSGVIGLIFVFNQFRLAGEIRQGPPQHNDSFAPSIYMNLWSESNPMRVSVMKQKALGAVALPHAFMDSLWNQGIAGNKTADQIPIYVARVTDPLFTTSCRMYGGRCNASGIKIHIPSYAVPQQAADGHMTVIDEHAPSGKIEVDCWQTTLSPGSLSCSWAGVFRLGGIGQNTGGEGVHFGRPVASYFLTGNELDSGHVDHALGINAVCLNNPSVYPAQTSNGTDNACAGGTHDPPHYGDLVHLLWPAAKITASSYSVPCKTILTALATFGAYLDDTGDNGLQIRVENQLSYQARLATTAENPWPRLQSELNAAGDGSGDTWNSCLNRLTSADFELLEDAQPRSISRLPRNGAFGGVQ